MYEQEFQGGVLYYYYETVMDCIGKGVFINNSHIYR